MLKQRNYIEEFEKLTDEGRLDFDGIPLDVCERVRSLYLDHYGVKPNKVNQKVIFVGYDAKENIPYQVLSYMLHQVSGVDVKVVPLVTNELRKVGLYTRKETVCPHTGQRLDVANEITVPFSTDFSFTRFLVPTISHILGLQGWVLFMDCDFMSVGPLTNLYTQLQTKFKDSKLALVKHDFTPTTTSKMDGVTQLPYSCKLWSSFMCFNMDSEVHKLIPYTQVNSLTGKQLHQFFWYEEPINDIVALPESYNFVPGHSDASKDTPILVHFTEKAPWFHGANKTSKDAFSATWRKQLQSFLEDVVESKELESTLNIWV